MSEETVELEDVSIEAETDLALLCNIDDKKHWIPKSVVHEKVNAIMITSNRGFFAERKWITELAGKSRLPAIYFQKEFVDDGGLMSYGLDYVDLYRQATVYVDKILNGAKPADLPVQLPTKFEFIINLKAAKQIGLTIPPNVLVRADRVIK